MEKPISKSFRLPAVDARWLQMMSEQNGITQTEVISKCIAANRLNEGKEIAIQSMGNGGITEDDEGIKVLTQLGIATASGFAGYHISGFIRKQLEMDEDKGTQILIGLLTGLGTLLLQAYHTKDNA
jgi:hypothetical protein